MELDEYTPSELKVEIDRMIYYLQFAKGEKRAATIKRIKEFNDKYNEVMLNGGENDKNKNEMGSN